MKPKFSKYYFKHLLFHFNPEVFVFPIALIMDNSGIELCTLWFGVVWYFRENKNDII